MLDRFVVPALATRTSAARFMNRGATVERWLAAPGSPNKGLQRTRLATAKFEFIMAVAHEKADGLMRRPTAIQGMLMPQWDTKRSPVRRAAVLRRTRAESGETWFYSLVVERDIFGKIVLVRNWGRMGTRGRQIVQEHPTEDDAIRAMDAIAERKRRDAYGDL
jgi:predicted DNA-binding WGR domain protein